MTFFSRTAFFLVLIFGFCAAESVADPAALTLDLATISPNDGLVRWVYGSSGLGDQGVPVAGGLDCDGDGWADVAVAHFKAGPLARPRAGVVDLVFGDGSTSGFVDTSFVNPGVLRLAGAGSQETAGSEIWIDDVTGDGLGDLLIARQNYTPEATRIGAGAVTILVGGPDLRTHAETLATVDLGAPPAALTLLTVVGAKALDRLGIWVRTGDVSGDGIADIVVGADQEDSSGEPNRGAVYIIRGGSHLASGGVIDLGEFGASALSGDIAKIIPPEGSAGYHFGATCQIADLDGNGRGEVLAAAALFRGGASIPAEGAPLGSAESVGGAPNGALYIAWDDNLPEGTWPAGYTIDLGSAPGSRSVVRGAGRDLSFGEEILGGLDYDNDGHADLFVGDIIGEGTAEASGVGYVFYQAEDLKNRDIELDDPPTGLRLTTFLGARAGALAGDTAAHGDFDGDGIADLAVASPHAAPQDRISAGSLHVLFGRPGGWPALIDFRPGNLPPSSAVRITEIHGAAGTSGSDVGDTLGYSAATGDVDGDGRTDLITNEMLGNGLTPGTIDVGNLIILSGTALVGEPVVDPESCLASSTTLCLAGNRFEVEVDWRDFEGETGSGRVVSVDSADSGLFWFFDADNWELLVKVLDGCGINNRFWVFSAATTNVEFSLKVTDTHSGAVRTYVNPSGVAAAATTDTDAFATCP